MSGVRERVEEILEGGIATDAQADEAIVALVALFEGDEAPVAWGVKHDGAWSVKPQFTKEDATDSARFAESVHGRDPKTCELVPLYTRPAPTQEVDGYLQSRLAQLDELRDKRAHDLLKVQGLQKEAEKLRAALEEAEAALDLGARAHCGCGPGGGFICTLHKGHAIARRALDGEG